MAGESWAPAWSTGPSDNSRPSRLRWLRSRAGIITTIWLLLLVAALLTRPFASTSTTRDPPSPANNQNNAHPTPPPANHIPAHNAPPVHTPAVHDAAHETTAVHTSTTSTARRPAQTGAAHATSLLRVNRVATTGAYWPGWDAISNMFTFGDSLTTTRFNHHQEQPNLANPFGNPPWPGNSSSAGPGWVAFLTGWYNGTFIRTANMARGGATTDEILIPPFRAIGRSFTQQMFDWWWPTYATQESTMNWGSHNTLFAMWFGSNDVLTMVDGRRNTTATLEPVVAAYARTVDRAYSAGARNFLFLNVAPYDRSPQSETEQDVAKFKHHAAVYNSALDRMAANLSDTYSDASTFVFDVHALWGSILDNPCAHALTCGLRNLTAPCLAYNGPMLPSDTFLPECGVPIGQYFWKDRVHPTYTVMNATAMEIARVLREVA